ncbi:MAG: DUF6588 family protein [Bacteroidota bacterium]
MKTSRQYVFAVVGLLVIGVILAAPPAAQCQTPVEDAIKQLSGPNAKGYLQPLADLFGANMNAGAFHSAKIPTVGFNIKLDLIVMGAPIGDDQKRYTAQAPTGFSPGTFETATIFGGTGGLVNDVNVPGVSYKGSDGVFTTTMFPLTAPQLTIGSVFGTQVLARYVFIPKLGDNVPESNLWGAGILHSVSQWLGGPPVDLAVGFFYNSFTAGDIITYSGYAISGIVSKEFTVFTAYGGLAYEQSTMNLNYVSTDPSIPGQVDIDLEGANTFRVTAGGLLQLGLFRLFADINIGTVTHFSGGIGIGN